jgi:hypothetical protein
MVVQVVCSYRFVYCVILWLLNREHIQHLTKLLHRTLTNERLLFSETRVTQVSLLTPPCIIGLPWSAFILLFHIGCTKENRL